MSTTVYEFSGPSISAMEEDFPRVLSKEIYAGDFGVRGRTEGGSLTLDKGASLPIPIYAVQSRITTTLRRTPRHVREGGDPFYIVWVIEKGEVGISSASDTKLLHAGSVIVLDSRATFFIEAFVGVEGEHRSLVALVPPHVFHASIRDDRQINSAHFASDSPHGRVVAELISLLFISGDILDERISASILRTGLDALARLLEEDQGLRHVRQTISEQRLKQVRSSISLHLGDPSFSLAKAAGICGISVRHICATMRRHGTSFSSILREERLDLAANLLRSPDMRHLAIAEIARISGFRNGAELSRSFARHFGITPRQARSSA